MLSLSASLHCFYHLLLFLCIKCVNFSHVTPSCFPFWDVSTLCYPLIMHTLFIKYVFHLFLSLSFNLVKGYFTLSLFCDAFGDHVCEKHSTKFNITDVIFNHSQKNIQCLTKHLFICFLLLEDYMHFPY